MRRHLKLWFTLGVVALVLTSCSSLKQQFLEQISFEFNSFDSKLSTRKVTNSFLPELYTDIRIGIQVTNDSPIALHLLQLNYNVFVGNSRIAQGENQDKVTVAAHGGESLVYLNLSLNIQELLDLGIRLTNEQTLPSVRIEGSGLVDSPIGKVSLPFSVRSSESGN